MIVLSVSLASNGVVKVPGYEQLVRFGYTKNRGVYRLTVTASGEWEGLTIRAFWHVPDGKDPASSLIVDGSVDVPASVTAQPGNGCITFEGSDGIKTVTSADLRYRVSANSGTEDGTEPEPGSPAWQQLVDAVHTDATAAEQAKNDAQTAANQADVSAGEAAASAKNAGQSAADALVWADAAKKSALAAGSNSQNAAQYAGAAKSFAEQAADSSSAAESSANAAAGSQQAAKSSANTAQESATQATGSASKAAQAQKNAETAADRAETAQQKTEEVRTDALDKISAAKADATAAVERTQKKALDAVTAAQGTAVKAVSDAQSTATQAVQTAQTDAVSAVEKAGSKVLESIPEDYQTTVKKVEELKTEKAEIDDTTVGPDAWSSKHIVDVLCPPLEETGNPVQCYPVAGYPLGCKVSWEPTQEGSGDPSPENIRPITGRDAVSVTRCGKNLFSTKNTIDVSINGITNATIEDNRIILSKTDGGRWLAYRAFFDIPVGTYTVSVQATCSDEAFTPIFSIYYRDIDTGINKAVSVISGTGKSTIKVPDGKFVSFFAHLSTEASYAGERTVEYSNIQIEPGSTATPYEPYTGSTTDIALPETVYGGEVDAVTGEGQDTWKLIDSYAGEVLPGKWISDRDVYASGTAPTRGAQVAYKLAEPISFAVTVAQPILALSGVNTVMTDADSATVTGRADPIKRITDLEDAIASMTTT